MDIDAVGKLDRMGVKCCLTVDSPLIGLDALLSHLEQAVREGADPIRAMKMVTIYPAELLGVDDRLGSIEIGKDANFAVFQGIPGSDMGAQVIYTIGEGEIKYRKQ